MFGFKFVRVVCLKTTLHERMHRLNNLLPTFGHSIITQIPFESFLFQASILQASNNNEHTPKLKCLSHNIGIKVLVSLNILHLK